MAGFSPEGYVSKADQLENQINNKKPTTITPLAFKTEWINPTGSYVDQGILGGALAYIIIVFLLEQYYLPESLVVLVGVLSPLPFVFAFYVLPFLWIPRSSEFGANRQIVKAFYGGGLTAGGGVAFKSLSWRGGQKLVMYKEALEISKVYHRQIIPFEDIKEIKAVGKSVVVVTEKSRQFSFAPNGDAVQISKAISTLFSRYLQEHPKTEQSTVFS